MNPTNKKIWQASLGLVFLLAFQVSAHSAPPHHAKVKEAAEACATELGMDVYGSRKY